MKKLFILPVILLSIVLMGAGCIDQSSVSGRSVISRQKAIKNCGEDNIQSHGMNDGSTVFECQDYSKLK